MSLPVSDNLVADRYRLVEPIGADGTAEVHRAWDTVLRRHVAVRLFPAGVDPAAARRFDDEVRTLAGLSHPGLVCVYDADTGGPAPFVVLQLVEGATLADRIAGGPLPADQVRRVGARLADALAHVHAHGLVHRDVTPSNILLDAEDNAYLANLGMTHLTGTARPADTGPADTDPARTEPTTSEPVVTDRTVTDRATGPAADVHALGLVLLECLTGRREHRGGHGETAPPTVPADLARLLSRMTSPAPHDRPPAQACARLLGVVPLPPDRPAPANTDDATVPLTPRRGSSPPWKTLIASAGVLLGAFAITTAATSGLAPVTSAPESSAPEPPAHHASPEAQEAQQDSPGTPAAGVPQRVVVTVQAPGTSSATTTPPPASPAEVPVPEPEPVIDPSSDTPTDTPTDTSTAPATTTGQQTSTPVPPTSESPEGTPEPTPPSGDAG